MKHRRGGVVYKTLKCPEFGKSCSIVKLWDSLVKSCEISGHMCSDIIDGYFKRPTNGTLANSENPDDSSSGAVKFILIAFSACEMILKSQPAPPYNE